MLSLFQILPVIEAALLEPKPSLSRSQLYSLMAYFLTNIEKNLETTKLASVFWGKLTHDLIDVFDTVDTEGDHRLRPDRILSFVKAVLSPLESLKSHAKSEHVKFAALERKFQTPSVNLSLSVECLPKQREFLDNIVVQSHKSYQTLNKHIYLKFFADLASLYFPADVAVQILCSTSAQERKSSLEKKDFCVSEESSKKILPDENTTVLSQNLHSEEDTADIRVLTDVTEKISSLDGRFSFLHGGKIDPGEAHSKVIQTVVLPVFKGGQREEGADSVEHAIKLLFACLPYLSLENSTLVWEEVLQVICF